MPSSAAAAEEAARVRALWQGLGLPGLVDVHVHFMPQVLDKDRVVLGSDPNVPYPHVHQLDALAALGLGDSWLRAVLRDNAARLLRP